MALIDTAFLDSKSYGFEWLRTLLDVSPLQEGVVGAGDFKVTPGTGGGQRVDVAAGTALVRGDTGTRNGLYLQVNDAPIPNALTLPGSDATLPRLDQVFLRVHDSSDLGDGSDAPTLEYVAGVPAAGATLDNRTGAVALPANAVRLADVLVPAGSATVTAGNIRDRRPWARGARLIYVDTSGNFSSTVTTLAQLGLAQRLETNGNPVAITYDATVEGSVNPTRARIDARVDGNPVDFGGGVADYVRCTMTAPGIPDRRSWEFHPGVALAAGSHVFSILAGLDVASGAVTIYGSSSIPRVLTVREDVLANNNNN